MKKTEPQICCVGGGKGGVGKSVVSLNMARALAADGLTIVLADLDLGGANLHTLVGLHNPQTSIRDFFGGNVDNLESLLVPVEQLGFSLLPGSDEVAGVIQPGYQRKLKMIRHLKKIDADVVICDLGGNASLDTLDIFNLADVSIVVTTSEPTSIQNAYGFIKASMLRKIWSDSQKGSVARQMIEKMWDPKTDEINLTTQELIKNVQTQDSQAAKQITESIKKAKFEMIVNMSTVEEAQRAYRTLGGVTRKFLQMPIHYLGFIESDQRIHKMIMQTTPPLIGKELFNPRLWLQLINRFEPAMAVGINEEITINGEVLHIQTEDLGRQTAAYHALVYSGGQILFSKRVAYDSPFLQKVSESKKERVRHLHYTVIEAIRSGRIALPSRQDETG